MGKLVAEQHIDKNGVTVTKHVRATPKVTAPRTPLPAPVPPAGRETKPAPAPYIPTAKQLENTTYALYPRDYEVTEALLKLLRRDKSVKFTEDYYRFTTSDTAVYDVASVVRADDAVALLSIGIRTAEEASAYLYRNRVEHIGIDHSDLTGEALRRRIPAISYLTTYHRHYNEATKDWIVDGAEAHSLALLRNTHLNIPGRVATGEIRFADIKTIGATRLVKALDHHGMLLTDLAAMREGTCRYNAEEARRLIDRFMISNTDRRVEVWTLAAAYGADVVLGFNDVRFCHRVHEYLSVNPSGPVPDEDVIRYADRLHHDGFFSAGAALSTRDAVELAQAGVDCDLAAEALRRGLPVRQIIATAAEGIAPSISGGWL